jgi:outer membrane protein TolC
MGSISMPLLRYQALDAALRQAQADLHASEARRRQASADLSARVVSDLAMIHDAQRQIALFTGTLIPRAEQIVAALQRTYATGQASMLDLLDAERSLIGLRRMRADLAISREKTIADLEGAAGLGMGALAELRKAEE